MNPQAKRHMREKSESRKGVEEKEVRLERVVFPGRLQSGILKFTDGNEMSLQALIPVHSHKTLSFSYLFPVEDKDELGWRVAGRGTAFRLECLTHFVRRSKTAQTGSFLWRDSNAHVCLAVDCKKTWPLRGHLATVRSHEVHLTCRVNYFVTSLFFILFYSINTLVAGASSYLHFSQFCWTFFLWINPIPRKVKATSKTQKSITYPSNTKIFFRILEKYFSSHFFFKYQIQILYTFTN